MHDVCTRSTTLDYEGVVLLDSAFARNTANAGARDLIGSGGGVGAATSVVRLRGCALADNGCGGGTARCEGAALSVDEDLYVQVCLLPSKT